MALMAFRQCWELVRKVTPGKWNKGRKMWIPKTDQQYLLIQVADHKYRKTTGPQDIIVAIATQIIEVVINAFNPPLQLKVCEASAEVLRVPRGSVAVTGFIGN